jgi:hypothetical protein
MKVTKKIQIASLACDACSATPKAGVRELKSAGDWYLL